jgi:hypothetical protein
VREKESVCPITRRSTGAHVVNLCFKSKLQRPNTLLSAEAEYVQLTECQTDALHLKYLLDELKLSSNAPISIAEDNQPAFKMATSPHSTSQRSRHIEAKYTSSGAMFRSRKLSHITCAPSTKSRTSCLPVTSVSAFATNLVFAALRLDVGRERRSGTISAP